MMAIGDRTQKRRLQITDRLALSLKERGNPWLTTRGMTEILSQQRTGLKKTRAVVNMRYMPTTHQLAKFVKMDERFEENPAEKLRQKEYRLKQTTLDSMEASQ